jgi:hypothetical protein
MIGIDVLLHASLAGWSQGSDVAVGSLVSTVGNANRHTPAEQMRQRMGLEIG